MFEVELVTSPFEIREHEPPAPCSDAALRRVEAIWRDEVEERGDVLFNGSLLSLTRRAGTRIEGWFTDYRSWLAQLRAPELRAALAVHAVGVCGVLRFGDAVLLGKRSDGLTQFPGLWELAPCGNLDDRARDEHGRLSPVEQLLRELEEELGVSRDLVREVTPVAVVDDLEALVCDLVYDVELDLGLAELEARFAERGDGELTAIRLFRPSELLTGDRDPTVSPFALAALRALS